MNKEDERLEIGGLIARLQRFHRRFMTAHLEALSLSGAMPSILSTLNQNPGVSQDFISERFNMDKGIIARQCKALEERNLIRRDVNENDRRQYCLYLTEEGEKLLPQIYDAYRSWTSLIARDFTEEELNLSYKLLSRMVDSCRSDLGEV